MHLISRISLGITLCVAGMTSAGAQSLPQSIQFSASQSPAPAQELIDAAVKSAKASNKVVFVHFGASWCGWCKTLSTFLAAPDISPIMAKHYVLLELTAQESDDKKALENPGANEILQKMGGGGLPVYAFLNGKGETLGTSESMPDGGGIGYPAKPEEIVAFDKLLKQSAPTMTDADHTTVIDHLTAFAKTIK